MSGTALKEEIEQLATDISLLQTIDLEPIFSLVERLLVVSWSQCAEIQSKWFIQEQLDTVLQETGASLRDIVCQLRTIPRERFPWGDIRQAPEGPMWEIIWRWVCRDRNDPLFRKLDENAYGRFYTLASERIVERLIERLPFAIPLRLRSCLQSYLFSIVWGYMLLCFKGMRNYSLFPKLRSLKKILDTATKGLGLLYASFYNGQLHLEVRLPVWKPSDYPSKIVEGREGLPISFSVIQEDVFVPEKVWRYPDTLTFQDLVSTANLEVRRVILQKLGNEALMEEGNAKLIDTDNDLSLYRLESGDIMFHLVRCVCPSTGGVYILRVPPSIESTREAIAWTFQESESSYKPLLET